MAPESLTEQKKKWRMEMKYEFSQSAEGEVKSAKEGIGQKDAALRICVCPWGSNTRHAAAVCFVIPLQGHGCPTCASTLGVCYKEWDACRGNQSDIFIYIYNISSQVSGKVAQGQNPGCCTNGVQKDKQHIPLLNNK